MPDSSHSEKPRRKNKKSVTTLGRGSILLARQGLEDPNFSGAVVLLCVCSNETVMGLVCNRPSHMPLCEIFSIDSPIKYQKRKMYIGGPVQQDSLQIVQTTAHPKKDAYEVAEDVYLGGEWPALEDILEADSTTTRLFLGYSGWAPGQLENEIRLGVWDVYNVSVKELLGGNEELLIRSNVEEIGRYLSNME
jgi:putative transcriptional regulator